MREYNLHIDLSLGSALLPQQIERLALAGGSRQLDAGEILYHQGDTACHIYLLRQGRMKTFMVNSGGQEALLRIHLSNSLLGLTALTTAQVRDASAIAIESSQLVAIRRDDFINLLKAEAELGVGLIQLVLDRLSDFHIRVGEIATNRVEQRLARALLSLSRPDTEIVAQTGDGCILLTHEELAQMINSRRQTVTAALSRFVQAGLIAYKGRHLVITDRLGLKCVLPE
ncbi:Crp/Fnr family transcriptional regulator [Acidiphilium sp. AL]|uniref:Crp/Fnr family transcriptional regulator n=1 Tax=Acidiphilium sp. AL TaxID=2871704 RepID=UPI0021CB3BF4|nr:Crp/Fnr family transcriptional regulator [Acidiphilium sp. AL]MCU4160514.1 Crp/Fnr family transcriptional regulator [Acidiphilium sp. AL]